MSDTPTLVEVVDKLIALGDAQQIALYLAAEGITGRIGASSACPIACYIQRETGDDRIAATGDSVFSNPEDDDAFFMFLDTAGTAVHRFVDAFDAGAYPELIARDLKRLERDEDEDE